MPDHRRTVLLTGASGVVGQALLPRLAAADVVCLVHRTPVTGPGVRSVAGDVTQPRFGLSAPAWRDLTRRVDAVVHAAALTDFKGADGVHARINVEGTRHAVDLAAEAGAPLYHVSSAYLHAREDGGRGRDAVRYAASKRAAEALVRTSGVPHTIVRPSVVIGDSRTGEASAFQGLHKVAEGILGGLVPIIPFDASWPLDVVPRDVVADAIARLVEGGHVGQELWLTAGERAPSLGDAVRVLLEVAADYGAPVAVPRFVDPETFDRLIAPVFLDALPAPVRKSATTFLEFFAAYLALDGALPSDLPALEGIGVAPLPDPRESLRASLRFWADETGLGTAAREVA